jgi:hypothetical protein
LEASGNRDGIKGSLCGGNAEPVEASARGSPAELLMRQHERLVLVTLSA